MRKIHLIIILLLFIHWVHFWGQTTSKFTVLIDPGHGGKDPGYIWNDTLKEKDLTMQYAHTLATELQKLGINYQFTHSSADSFLSIQKRLEKMEKRNATLFISLHISPVPSDSYTVELIVKQNDSVSTRLSQELKSVLKEQNIPVLTSQNKFSIIRYAPIPAIMIILRTGKSLNGVEYVLSRAFRSKFCENLANGVKKIYGKN